MPRYIDAEKFDVVSSAVPDGLDPDSYCAGMDFVLQKIETAPTENVISIVYSTPQKNILRSIFGPDFYNL